MKINFIADFFLKDMIEAGIPGGGELNNHEVIITLREKGHTVETINTFSTSPSWIRKRDNFIIANFLHLSEECKNLLLNKNYLIYEHDHKYIMSRDPGLYKDFVAPKDQIVNLEFYQKAKAVLCQSNLHMEIIKKNIGLNNLINLSGNLWSADSLEHMKKISQEIKKDKYCILASTVGHKNTSDAMKYCKIKKYDYVLVSDLNYYNFLSKMGENKTFVFFPKTPETLSRVTVEARMMNMKTITNNKVGASKEPWFKFKGEELIGKMNEKRETITDRIIEVLNE
tara:strand:+ start:864 stop:1712 length:849 start_codon:yes stop_codon:yes gene_type:complete